MLFLWYPKCTTCQKAKAFLDERGVSYEARDIKLENPTAEELRGWWEKSGMPLKKFFNTSGLQYKALGLKDKLPGLTEEEQLALLAGDGMLVKRPVLVGDDFVLNARGEPAFVLGMDTVIESGSAVARLAVAASTTQLPTR